MAEFRWYVAQALPGLESTAIHHLSREGVSAWAPVATKDRQLRLFPGYVFVELESPSEAGIVNRTRGIRKMLPIHCDSPLPLPRGFVEDLRARMASGEFEEQSADEFLRRFVPGETVSISSGAFSGLDAKFMRYSKGSGVLLMALLGREHEVRIPLQALAPAGNAGRAARPTARKAA